jgi:hypothetical protein
MDRRSFIRSAVAGMTLGSRVFAERSRQHQRLVVSPDGHYLQYKDGTPFFWLGDTAWYLFLRLNKKEIEAYIEDRREKGFNIVQAAILRGDLTVPNQHGEIPFQDLDPAKPHEGYFQLVDWTIQTALDKEMFIGLLPTWGDQVSDLFGTGSIKFNKDNAYDYGCFLGRRYKACSNIIWILGGDQPAFTDSMDWRPVWRAMIKGIREGSGGHTLLTYHPWGEHSSSEYWGNEDILDLNMVQSGHARHDVNVWKWITRDFNTTPARPVLDGEPNYEDHPVNWKIEEGYFRDYDVRKQLYRSVFSGACGVTYGHQAIRQFYSDREEPMGFPDRYWTEALDRPGAFQAGYLKRLILSRPPLSRVPDQTLIKRGQGEDGEYITAFRGKDNSYAMIYLPLGKEIEVNVSWMQAARIVAWWFNPRTGEALKSGVLEKKDSLRFVPPTTGPANDWVLVLDDSARERPAPGDV